MNANDLARLMSGANITINIQGGTGNVMYTGTVNQAAPSRMFRCVYCGRTDPGVIENLLGDFHPACQAASRAEALRLADEIYDRKSRWRITSRDVPEIAAPKPLQIEAPEPLQIETPEPLQIAAPRPREIAVSVERDDNRVRPYYDPSAAGSQ